MLLVFQLVGMYFPKELFQPMNGVCKSPFYYLDPMVGQTDWIWHIFIGSNNNIVGLSYSFHFLDIKFRSDNWIGLNNDIKSDIILFVNFCSSFVENDTF